MISHDPPSESSGTTISLEHFFTVAFDLLIMLDAIRIDDVTREIDAQRWMSLVPEVYRPSVTPLVLATFERFRGQLLDQPMLREFVQDLYDRIHRD